MENVIILLVALFTIFLAAEIFTNALEHLGERLGVSEGVTGSVFAAVGTAMPETIVPIVAILAGGASIAVNHDIGMGAILGAPFMLATLSLCLVGLFAGLKRGWATVLQPEQTGFQRDIKFFFVAYTLVVAVAWLPVEWQQARIIASCCLLGLYGLYLFQTITASKGLVEDGHGTEADSDLYFKRFLGDSTAVAILQFVVAIIILIVGAKLFVHGVEHASAILGVGALVLSLLIVPIATELPEKINSILWIRKGRDTLAFGNITGAMVFQGTVIPAIGMLLLPWHFEGATETLPVLLALLGSCWLFLLQFSGRLNSKMLLCNGLFYLCFLMYIVL
ncbi:MAG: sodium:calcium antiporter [Mariprofundaceae bacterium]